MAIEELMAKVFNEIIEGQQVNKKIGDWTISNLNSLSMISLMYNQDAVYGFQVEIKDNLIQFNNYHREAKKGTGTKSLGQLEKSLKSLALSRNQKIVVLFYTFGQEDTKSWLEKNRYTKSGKEIYQKEFLPK